MAERKRATKQRRREKKNVPQGHAHIQASFNNTIITITDVTPVPHNGCRPPKRRRV